MRWSRSFWGLAVLGYATAGALSAAELKSGPQVGDGIGAFHVLKCAGAVDDGVKVGDELCYR